MIWQRWLMLGIAAVVLASVPGCGSSGPSRFALTGAVTFKGRPVPRGEIRFRPDDAAGNKGPGSVARIVDGRYELPSDLGVVGGAYIVEITGFDGVPVPPSAGGEPSDIGSPLFANYSTKVELKKGAATQDFDVPSDAPAKPAESKPLSPA